MEEQELIKAAKKILQDPHAALDRMIEETYSAQLDKEMLSMKDRKALVRKIGTLIQKASGHKLPDPPTKGFGFI